MPRERGSKLGFLGKLFGGGSSAKTDRSTTLQGYGDLGNVFNMGMDQSSALSKTGTGTQAEGVSALQQPLSYYSKMLSGDRTALSQAIAPEANSVQAQADASKKQSANMGTARGGGVAGANQSANDATTAKIDNALFQARPAAAQGETQVAGKLADIGTSDINAALGFGNLASGAAQDLTGDSISSRMDSYKINQNTTAQVTQSIQDLISGALFGQSGQSG